MVGVGWEEGQPSVFTCGSVLFPVRVFKVNTKVSSQMLDDVTLHDSRPAQLQGLNSAYSLSTEGYCSLLLLLQLLISVPLSWKHFTNYKSTYEPGHACGFMWTAGSGVISEDVCVAIASRDRTGKRNRDSIQTQCPHRIASFGSGLRLVLFHLVRFSFLAWPLHLDKNIIRELGLVPVSACENFVPRLTSPS